jgi:hypothetical protein
MGEDGLIFGARTTAANDEDYWAGVLLFDDISTDEPALLVHRSSAARDRVADPRDARRSS